MNGGWLLIFIAALILVLGCGAWVSRDSRLRRRRRKNHSRIVSSASRPSVRLSVRPPKKD